MDPNGFSDEEKEEGVYEHSYYGYTHMEIHLVVVNQFFTALVARCYHFQMRQHPTDKLTLTSIRHLKKTKTESRMIVYIASQKSNEEKWTDNNNRPKCI